MANEIFKREEYETDKMFFVRRRTTGKFVVISFELDEGYISCDMCACCYGKDGDLDPSFCQIFSYRKDPENFDDNRNTAMSCPNYVPKFMVRSMVKTPEVERWYEKDSMA